MEPGTVLDISMQVNGITFTEVEIIIGNGTGIHHLKTSMMIHFSTNQNWRFGNVIFYITLKLWVL